MAVEELPYWETINKFLEKLDPQELQDVIHKLVKRLLRSRAFEGARIQNKYWQIIIDGTQIYSSRKQLDEKSLYRVHNRGKENEYTEYYYYVLEAKLVLHPKVIVSIMTEFVENTDGNEAEKQDCGRKACYRFMNRLKKEFPHLPICLNADSLYACENFFHKCQDKGWRYILRFKDGSIPTIADEFGKIKKTEGNRQEQKLSDGVCWYDFVIGIDYNGYEINVVEYVEERSVEIKKGPGKGGFKETKARFVFLTDIQIKRKNVAALVDVGRRRWKIENEGFNTQKKHGYYMEHLFSKNYQAIKNHYFLTQIGHMISQIMEAWKKLWKKSGLDMAEKHARILESFRSIKLCEYEAEIGKKVQMRFQ